MGIRSWKKEFYSPISKVKKDGAIDHCIIKWTGLRPENLKKHGLKINYYDGLLNAWEEDGWADPLFHADSSSCALCRRNYECETCPIWFVTNKDCHVQYDVFLETKNPEPMIELLEFVKAEMAKVESK